MNRISKLFIVCLLLCVSVTTLIAAPNAEKLYRNTKETDLAAQSLDSIIKSYDRLFDRVAKETQAAERDLMAAIRARDVIDFREAYDRLATLSTYGFSQEETDLLLSRILREEEPAGNEHAAWLHANSAYYQPTLHIDFSLTGDGYRYSYTQRIRKTPGSEIVLPDASHIKANTTQTGILAGWGLTPDTVDYQPGETITMPLTDQTLYAIWKNAVTFSDAISETDVMYESVKPGDTVSIPVPPVPDETYRFAGWYDAGSGAVVKDGTYTVRGRGASFEGIWKQLTVESIAPILYEFDRLPVRTQIAVGFSLSNKGNAQLEGLVAKLESDSPYVTILDDTVFAGDLPGNMYRTHNSRFASESPIAVGGESNTFRFVIDSDAPSGSVIPLVMTIVDRHGETWVNTTSFTVR